MLVLVEGLLVPLVDEPSGFSGPSKGSLMGAWALGSGGLLFSSKPEKIPISQINKSMCAT